MFYMSKILNKPRISVKRKLKRTFVILKSPFHYKTPKHHIQYSYYAIYATVSVDARHASVVRGVLSSFFLQNKPNRVEENKPYRLDYNGIV